MLHILLEIIIMTRSTKTRLLLRDKCKVVYSDRLYRPILYIQSQCTVRHVCHVVCGRITLGWLHIHYFWQPSVYKGLPSLISSQPCCTPPPPLHGCIMEAQTLSYQYYCTPASPIPFAMSFLSAQYIYHI